MLKIYELAIKDNLIALENGTLETGKAYINIANLLKNATQNNIYIDYTKVKQELSQ